MTLHSRGLQLSILHRQSIENSPGDFVLPLQWLKYSLTPNIGADVFSGPQSRARLTDGDMILSLHESEPARISKSNFAFKGPLRSPLGAIVALFECVFCV